MPLREQQLLSWINHDTHYTAETFNMVSGDASFRRYFRFEFQQQNYLAVDAPPQTESNKEFLEIARGFSLAGIHVPDILAVDLQHGFWVLQDFGDTLLFDCIQQPNITDLYTRALDVIPLMQSVSDLNLPYFDDALLELEFDLFNHWLLQKHLQLSLSEREIEIIRNAQDAVEAEFKAQPKVLMHRDYHSRNLMILPNEQIGVIDFQGAVIGPITYDAVSLLRDCYVTLPTEQVDTLLRYWHQQYYSQYPQDTFLRWFDFVGMQRHIKASGIFCRLCYRDGKSGYLSDIPVTLKHLIGVAKAYPETAQFAELVQKRILPAVLAKGD